MAGTRLPVQVGPADGIPSLSTRSLTIGLLGGKHCGYQHLQMARDYPILVATQGNGNLLTQPSVSLENVGDGSYSAKVNFRRQGDQEIRREGWIKFRPNLSQPVGQQYIWDGADNLLKLAEIVRPNGDRAIVGASATQIKRFNTTTFQWDVIGSGYSVSGARWQVESINGYLILNNTVDLPCYFRVEYNAVVPMYEMRDVGIASVGNISQLSGFLKCLNVVMIDGNQLNQWMTGYPNYVNTGIITENTNFSATAGNTTKQFNVTTAGSALVLTLPAVQPAPTWWILVKKVDAGVGSLVTSPVILDQTLTLDSINDTALIWSDGVSYFAKFFEGGVIPAANAYGLVPSDIVNHIPYRVTWSAPGYPVNWAPQYPIYMAGASATLTLPFATSVLKVGDLVGVIGGGPNGGTLGGTSAYPNGVPIVTIAGNQVTLAISTDAGNTYPATVRLVRWADIGSLVGFYDVQGDGSAIVGAEALQGKLMIYKETSIFVDTYVAIAGAPFTFVEKYVGTNTPIFGDCIASMNGQYHMYPGTGNRFYIFDGITYPIIHTPTDNARDLFFNGITNNTAAWAIENPLTKEIWFCRPGLVFAFDYQKNTVAQIDTQIDAAVFCKRPGSNDDWIVLGIAGNTYTYGLVAGVTPITTWLRDGAAAVPQIQSGLITASTQMNEKLLIEYTPLLSSPSPDMAISVQISTTYNPSAPLVAQMSPAAALPDPQGNNYMPCAFQGIYFQDLITVTDARDMDCRLSGRILKVQDIGAGSVTRNP